MMRFVPKATARTSAFIALCAAGLLALTCFNGAAESHAAAAHKAAGGHDSAALSSRGPVASPAAYRATTAAAVLLPLDVDRTDDDVTAIACTPAPNDCSLRGAVITANIILGSTINVPAGTYQLTITGSGEQFAATGDLDIRASGTSIVGAGAATTIIQQTVSDRVLEVNPGVALAGFTFNLSGVTIKGGNLPTGSGGGMVSGGNGAVTTITDCVFDNNKTTGAVAANGGAITDATGTGSTMLTITNCAFTNNTTATGVGGAIRFSSPGTLTITRSLFLNNKALANSGGAINATFATGGTYNISQSAFVGNQANGAASRGGALAVGNGTANVSFSRLSGNTAGAANGKTLALTGVGTLAANDNWWGQNSGPLTSDLFTSLVTRWLQLRLSAAASQLCPGATTGLTADIYGRNVTGAVPNCPGALCSLNGLPPFAATFGATNGSVSPTNTQFVDGATSSTFTAGAAGAASASVTADLQTVNTNLTVSNNTTTSDPADVSVCQGAMANFSTTPSGSGPFHYAWTLDGSPFDGDNPSITVDTTSLTTGAHTVSVTVSGGCGSPATQTATLTVQPSTTTTDPADATVCQGATATFSTTATGANLHYAWTLDGSPFDGDNATINVPTGALSVGAHSVGLTVTGACGTATQSATLTVQANTTASDPADVTVCQGVTANFSTTASGTDLHYAWTLDSSPFGTDSSSISVPTGSLSVGVHTVGLTVTGTCGTVSHTASLTVQANTTASDPADATVCQGATAVFSTTATGDNLHYAWTLDGSSFGGDSSSISVATGSLSIGAHSVGLTVTGTCGTVSQTASLTVQENTSASDPGDVTVCQGTPASFSTTASGTNIHYAWTLDGLPFNGDSPNINVPTGSLSVGTHSVGLTVTGDCGTVTQSATLTVQANTSTTKPADVAVCHGELASFSTTASGTAPFHYAWTLDGLPYNGDSPSITVNTALLTPGAHTVTVTTTGACSSATQSATLTVGGPPTITLSQITATMWPPNHAYNTFNVSDFVASASSGCDPSVDAGDVVIASVTSDELDDNPSGGDGTTVNDIRIAADCKSVQLRAERDGNLNGRVYTITYIVKDSQGNTATATVTVTVPVSRNGTAVNDGPHNTVNGTCP